MHRCWVIYELLQRSVEIAEASAAPRIGDTKVFRMLRILFLYLTKVGLQRNFVNQGRAFPRRPRWFLRAGRTLLWLGTGRIRLRGRRGGWICYRYAELS
ncbi:hypothetical protein LAUMK42_03512 [Mycobacterium persicum]|uniref:Secreted protein n=1 Tax=Mycobacterium persicum TaxID=1487726 RepID=A0AB38UW05_9MYCO|nr:hypothetical protein LAUMK42_03512 [Mycobacterium persicum]